MMVTGRNEREKVANTNETTLKFIACYDSWSNHTDGLTTNAPRSLIINAAKYVNNRRYFIYIYIRIHTNSLYFIIDFYVSQAITKSNLSKTFSNESLEFNIQKTHPLS